MALQTIPGGLWIPHPYLLGDAGVTFNVMLLNGSSEKAAGVFRAPKTGTISKVGFLTGTVTTGVTVDVRLETVDLANGDPSGTLLGTNSNGSQVIADSDDNTWFTTTLTTGVAVTKGDLLAVVIANAGSGDLNIRHKRIDRPSKFPYTDHFTASWTKNNNSSVFSLEYSDGSYAYSPGVWPASTQINPGYGSGSDPDEKALIFQLPFPFRVTGVWVSIDLEGAPADIILYDSDGTTELRNTSLDPDVVFSNQARIILLSFAGTDSLSANTNYRLSSKPTSATQIKLGEFDVDAVAIMDAFEGGQNFHHSERTNAGAWTEITTRRPLMGLLIDAVGGASQLVGGGLVS